MALDRQHLSSGMSLVTFRIPAQAGASAAELVGEFNDWTGVPMRALADGGFEISVELSYGRSYRFRYLLDGHRWENDWQADHYAPNEYGGDDSVIDLSRSLAERAGFEPAIATLPRLSPRSHVAPNDRELPRPAVPQ